ncbi:MAG: Beta-barrel assembly-enhancing protease [Phycisphaerae bacterium]|nr:Beta-barrel assembly-enhancing protease [Phycisphaerae bacterium]
MSAHLERGNILMRQSRFDLAERELRQALHDEPGDDAAHALLAICLCAQKRPAEALPPARQAVQLVPDAPFNHYALAYTLDDLDKLAEAEQCIRAAIELDPSDADYRSLLASLHLRRGRWNDALAAADDGLAIDPQHGHCANIRAMALVKLGRREEARQTIDGALERSPDSASAHANRGWALLHENRPHEAVNHFREALRLEPGLEWARAGVIEALKARNIVYRLMLSYFLFMSRLSSRAQWGIIIGLFLGYRLIRALADTQPALRGYLTPFVIGYVLFAGLTWLAQPVFNLLLRFDRFGRHALSRDEIIGSNWVTAALGLAMLSLSAHFVTGLKVLLFAALIVGVMAIPLSATFHASRRADRPRLATLTAILAAVGFAALLAFGLAPDLAPLLFGAYFLGIICFEWLGVALSIRRPA